MSGFPLLAVHLILSIVAVLFVICCVALILIVLIQKGKGGGLSAAFGGGMASGILGSKTGDFLTWVTITLAAVFLILAVVMAKFYKPGPDPDFDAPAQREPLASPEQPLPPGGTGDTTSDANGGTDANLPSG